MTDAGTLAALGLELESVTTAPEAPGADVSVTVPVPDCPPTTVDGVTDRLCGITEAGFTVTPAVMLTPE